jgi:pimeloyl-ACP methyl ester carboxylesterase
MPLFVPNILFHADASRLTSHMMSDLQEAASKAEGAIDAGETRVLVLPDAGHWLHVDNPGGLLQMVLPSLSEGLEQSCK